MSTNFLQIFESKTKKSKKMYVEASKYLPGGVSGGAAFMAPYPIYVDRAEGGKLFDIDGNEYIDLGLCGFLNILGHSPKPVIDAVSQQLNRGTAVGLFQEMGIELAKRINKHMPHMEAVRFLNTASEATQCAIRLARAWTKKDKIAKIEGGYNGQHDFVMVSTLRCGGSSDKPIPVADCAGIPQFLLDNTIVLPFNDIDATVSIIKENAKELAAVIIEPMTGFVMGSIPADREYMEALRNVTKENDIVLIYDETVTAFRVSGMGGATKYYGVTPDLTCIGKPIGGGFPVGAFGGRRDIMQLLHPLADPESKVSQSGTFTGNPITMTAGLACLKELETKDYSYIDNLAEKVRNGLRAMATDRDFEIQMTGMASIFCIHFNNQPIRNNRDRLKDDLDKQREFSLGMVANGVLWAMHPGAVCFAHTENDMNYVLETAEKVLNEMKR